MTEDIVLQTHKFLLKHKITIAVAESCSGGILSSLLTRTSGSSTYFILGLVTYSNRAKESLLAIPSSLIKQKGVVSEEIARKMASRVRTLANADLGIGITGIAGPTGGNKDKPVGTVFIAVANKKMILSKKYSFRGERKAIRNKAAIASLGLLQALFKNARIHSH